MADIVLFGRVLTADTDRRVHSRGAAVAEARRLGVLTASAAAQNA